MRSAGKAGIEAVNGTQDFKGLRGNGHFRIHERGLVGAELPVVASRGGIPCRRDNALIMLNLLIFDGDPVAKRAPRGFCKADAAPFLRP